ncbi:OmpA family protein [Gillisia sp. M10.2A]|uniref:OmpA family protein n=1 Tax=Gillisia lutea TaxID=2909668 RepID=A0ABS9EMZ3_9FLAO|nr:OmpA family protein [Gillisia lutea]MCF4102826.1 OmpA family protein [Gillisia lutea]
MKNHYYIFILLIVGNSFMLNAQNAKQRKADKLFENLAYVEAVKVYQELIDNDFNADYNKRQIADSYVKLRRPDAAVLYYADVVDQPSISPEYYYKYAQALRGVKRYDESKTWLKKYQESKGNTKELNEILNGDISKMILKDNYTISNVHFNSEKSDFGAFEKDSVVFFVSARDDGISKRKKIYSWNGEPFLDIYTTSLPNKDIYSLKGDVNSVLHDGPIAITKDGKYLYFNRNNYLNKKEGKRDVNETNNLKIYRATNIDGKWEDIVELPFNNDNYSVGHPSLSPDNKTLYYASDIPNGFGGTDIYKVPIFENNTYGKPVNLGPHINTKQDETFPFLTADNILYFSSNGHPGLGLMDIFKTDIDDLLKTIENLGTPVNSNMDDFAFFKKSNDNTGYFSSNREGGVGSDDIYNFTRLKALKLKGQVTDIINNAPIPNATIRLFDEKKEQVAFLETDKDGNYQTDINRNIKYPIEAKHIEYQEKSGIVNTFNTNDVEEIIYNIQLEPVQDVEYLAEINNIYFDFDKSNIRADAQTELNKLVDLMQNKYPQLVLEISSHTDIRGSNEYNEALALRRANATYEYLISKGISANRISTYKGYGETMLAVDCKRCNEVQHQLNRRSMFKVVSMK